MKLLLVLALAQLAFGFELTDPDWVAFKVSIYQCHSVDVVVKSRLGREMTVSDGIRTVVIGYAILFLEISCYKFFRMVAKII